METDPHKLAKRQQQIDIGKNTRQYRAYARARREDPDKTPKIPMPRITDLRSTRSFRGLINEWKRRLHAWYNEHGIDYDNDFIFIPDQTYVECTLCGSRAHFKERKHNGFKFCSERCLRLLEFY